MKRKIVQHGSSSLTLTLPIKWADKYGLKKGDELDVEESGPMLTIRTQKENASSKKEVSLSEFGIFTKNNISHLYQLGYDEIEIKFENADDLQEIKKRLPNCIGFEIIDQRNRSVLIKSIATTLDSEFDTLLRKSFFITNELAKEIIEAINAKDLKKLKELREMESLNNKFTDVCLRILNKKGYKIPNRSMQMYEIVKNLERIADDYKYICDLFSESNELPDKKSLEIFEQAVQYYLSFYSIFYKFDKELKRDLYFGRKKIIEACTESMKKSKGVNVVFMHHTIGIVQKSYEGAGGYFALTL